MNTNPPDDFERRLAGVPLSEPPAAWRKTVLARARAEAAKDRDPIATPDSPAPWRWLHWLQSPWMIPAGAWALVLLLGAINHRLETQHDPGQGLATLTAPQRDTLFAAARAYRAQATAFEDPEEPASPIGQTPQSAPAPARPSDRAKPRSERPALSTDEALRPRHA